MELRTYTQILLKKWWIVVPVFLVTFTTAIAIAYTQTPRYTTTTTFVVAPASTFGDVRSFASGLSILSAREEILATYTEVAVSNKIKAMAAEAIGLESAGSYKISSDLLKGTNVMKVTVEGPDPTIVRDLSNSIGSVTIKYVKGLYEVYTLALLDEAPLPRSPTSPDKTLNISLGAVLGLILGIMVAFLFTYLEPPAESTLSVNIIDDKTGAYNKQFFLQRLGEEMVRAKRNRYPLSVALMRIDNLQMVQGLNAACIRTEALHQAAVLLKQYLREEDVLAYMGENVFALLLPDVSGHHAQATLEYLQTRLTFTPVQSSIDTKLYLQGVVGIVTYHHNGTRRDQLMDMAAEALELAEVRGDGKVHLITETDSSEVEHSKLKAENN